MLNCHTEEALQSGIIQSVWCEVRELIWFIGFQADLTNILDQVKERFGKVPTANKPAGILSASTRENGEDLTICQSLGTKV